MQANVEEEVEVGLVDGLFEMYKLRCDIEKTKAELIADGAVSSFNHNFGTFIFVNHIDPETTSDLGTELRFPDLIVCASM